MATVSHKDLTGADLHEPKGAALAASGTVYVANGAGSGSWTTLSALNSETGRIAIYATPTIPSGWLECDGSAISRSTFSALFTVLTVQQAGSRTNGSPTITALGDVSNIKAGYFVGGTGITNGTTILSVGAGTITMNANATSSGSSTVIVSPYPLGNGTTTFNIPNLTDTGRFPRSRTSALPTGTSQANQNKAHTHTGATGAAGAHTHSGTTAGASADHSHGGVPTFSANLFYAAGGSVGTQATGSTNTAGVNTDHTHSFATTSDPGNHTHTISSDGGTEAKPETHVFLFCIRT